MRRDGQYFHPADDDHFTFNWLQLLSRCLGTSSWQRMSRELISLRANRGYAVIRRTWICFSRLRVLAMS